MDYKRLVVTFSLAMLVVIGFQYMSADKDKVAKEQEGAEQSTLVSGSEVDTVTGDAGVETDVAEPLSGTEGLRVKVSVAPVDAEPVVLGSLETDKKYNAEVTFDRTTAAVSSVLLNNYKYVVSDEAFGYPLLNTCKTTSGKVFDSFMVTSVKIEGYSRRFDLSGNCWTLEKSEGDTVSFKASIVDGDKPYLDIVKVFTYSPEDFELSMDIELKNYAGHEVKVEFVGVTGPVGVLREDPRTDRRNVFVGYFKNQNAFSVEMANNKKVVDNKGEFINTPDNKPMEWFAQGNKFFTAVMRPVPEGEATVANFVVNSVHARAGVLKSGPEEKVGSDAVIPYTEIVPGVIAAGQSSDCQYSIYLGPIDKELFDKSPYFELNYSATGKGASCAVCTFGWLNAIIFKLMQLCYMVTSNYGISIIFLVFLVRFILHPITKKSQINMQQMSKLGPKMEEVKQKHANNPKEMQRQMALVYKEQGFSPIMGCLPMLLQMPIWIALYTSVDSNVGLRHKGLFPAGFPWLNDLSAPDRLIPFTVFGGGPIDLPLLGHVDAFNLLPILLCIAMYFQSKSSMAQNTSAATSPEAAQQQKMMMYMMPVMMLVFFYTAPSGLNMYIMASTFAGLIEQKRIKKHLQEQDQQQEQGKVHTTSKLTAKFAPKKKKDKGPNKQF